MSTAPADTREELKYYIEILYNKRLLIGLTFVVTFLMIMLAYVLTPPVYVAGAKVLIEPEQQTEFNNVNRTEAPQPFYFQTEIELIRSDVVLSLAVKKMGIASNARDSQAAIARLKMDTTIERLADSRIFTISVKSKDAGYAVKAANAIADGYIEYINEEKRKNISDITLWLQGELSSLKNKVEKAQLQLIKYVEEQESNSSSDEVMFLGSPTENVGTKALSELETKYVSLQIELTNLLQKYKDKYPLVVQTRNDLEALKIRIDLMKQAMLEANRKQIKYLMLQRDLELSKDLYNLLTKELKEVNIFGEISLPTASIIEYAQGPLSRAGAGFLFWFLFGLLVSSIVGIASALIADQIDNSIKNETDIEKFIKYPIIGAVPYIDALKENGIEKLIGVLNSASSQPFSEALRLIRTNLKYSFVTKTGKTILITSTGEGEGKTTIATSLSYILSIVGAKVLLLDADVKRPTIHKVFKGEQTPGYTELLVDDNLYIGDIIRETGYKSFHYLPAGTQPPNFAELIDSSRSRNFIEVLKDKFDYIIIDSPPIGSVSDAVILSSQVDGVLFVVKSNGYPREHILRNINSLTAINAKIIGMVLTNIENRGSYYYRNYYTKGYYGK